MGSASIIRPHCGTWPPEGHRDGVPSRPAARTRRGLQPRNGCGATRAGAHAISLLAQAVLAMPAYQSIILQYQASYMLYGIQASQTRALHLYAGAGPIRRHAMGPGPILSDLCTAHWGSAKARAPHGPAQGGCAKVRRRKELWIGAQGEFASSRLPVWGDTRGCPPRRLSWTGRGGARGRRGTPCSGIPPTPGPGVLESRTSR